MEKATMHSLDMVNENIKKIGCLFPECITETVGEDGKVKVAIDFEKLQENLSHATIGEGEERYQFTWPGKREAIHNANAPTNMTLRPCKEESVDFDNTQNLYIEGDNLEVLKLLQENYLGKIKMIYIDPPYNTGNDFVYNDDFKEDTESFQSKSGMYDEDGNMLLQNFEKNTESNGRFHTDWLNMMYPRLKVARNLLSDDGVIFISIDDNEQENLKKICDEVFGALNFIANFAWKRKKEISNDSNNVAIQGEYVLCYGRGDATLSLEPLSAEYISKSYNDPTEAFPLGKWRPVPLTVSKGLNGGGYTYTITTPSGKNHTRLWAYPESSYTKLVEKGLVYFGKDGSAVPQRVMYAKDSKGQPTSNYWDNVATNKEGKKEILELFGDNFFDTPKPINLLKKILLLATKEDSIILDFFSGSATTAHAVMQLNAEDNGNRKFVCVQLPEVTAGDSEAYKAGYKNICEIGKERIRRAGKKIMDDIIANNETSAVIARSETTKQSKDSAIDCRASLAMTQNSQLKTDNYKLDIGFRVLKLADSNMKDVFYSPAETTSADIFDVDNVKEDRTPLDLLFQVMPECNLPLSSKIEERSIEGKTVYFVNGNYLVACFDEGITEKLIKSVIDVPDSDKPYYFYMRNIGLGGDKVLDNFEQLFVHYSPSTKRKVI
ncbi:site-specific DNA-methyltransferase [Fibrobacter sp. UWS1]|uniref:site-specific DNA-methyltransferase n=1 Tax=Fibrobacter sp. UWS1 TaxID=1896220 RepID=UPI000BB0F7B1|nr:site-specific DNA-methyltransferase [Fibrobacter sp. UWS1]PBC68189.1 adenine-specific DNA-methyltransferase [Fibrobacter sp. UWS1]